MRVAYVCADPGVPVFGSKGASVHVTEVLRVLVGLGARVDLFCRRTGGVVPPGLSGVRVHRLPAPVAHDAAARELELLGQAREIEAAVQAAGPFDLVYERYSLWNAATMGWARSAGVPAVLEVNAPLVDEQAEHRTLVHRDEALSVLRAAAMCATVVSCVTEPVAGWVQSVAGPAPVLVQPNGVDVDRFRPAPGRRPHPFTVGFVGTLKPWHGVGVLAHAFALLRHECPEARLLVVGDGPGAPGLRASLEASGCAGSAELTGAVPPSAIPALLRTMDVATAPYPADAGAYFSPLKVYEYLATGLPVIASRTGQLPKVVRDGVDGVLVPPGDPAALARELIRLRRDPGRRRRLGRAARAGVERHHTWRAVVTRTLAAAGVGLDAPGRAVPETV
ncbi:glycosyltransferase family 4 protein [Jiangella alba]|uniref:Glycosyltransferase involved in cell wall bisynthesis n=1 Tax=Jiangella alba TaxID=561176 RepID=A0A1H5PWC9_9ACTN|nr:glycosyltransferase family 4 protein [Jiangella alba]SEF17498.1 Glycosyltransferase involved in cell wall bisynthesis [Jiangella alba]